MEVIQEIREGVEDIGTFDSAGYGGFTIVTDQQEIKLFMYDRASCCEQWAYFLSEDDLDKFIGAEVRDIYVTDEALETVEVPVVYEGSVMFVTVETNLGPLQFVAYNEHNGYYGHGAGVVSIQAKEEYIL